MTGMFDHVDWKAHAASHREGAERARSEGRMASYHARLEQARQCDLEAEKQIIERGPETVENGQCTACGRDYSNEPRLRRCPSDDCPSHWEEIGLKMEG